MGDIISFVTNNWKDVVSFVLQVIGVASIVVKFTPSPKDDAILGKVKDFVSKWVALNPNK